ncbi:MAG: Ig-like domain-containing protein, partial [Blastocatellia bacterium]
MARKDELTAFDPAGKAVTTIQPGRKSHVYDLAFDRYLDRLWVNSTDGLRRYDAQGQLVFEVSGRFRGNLQADGVGGLWLAQKKELIHLNDAGGVDLRLKPFSRHPNDNDREDDEEDEADDDAGREDKEPAASRIVDIVADPQDASVWVASNRQLKHYALDGALLGELTPALSDGVIRRLGRLSLYADRSAPELRFTVPGEGALLAQKRPALELEYFDPGSAINAGSLRIKQGGGTLLPVACTHAAGTAHCVPGADLQEGEQFLTATIADLAGNVSEPAERRIVMDTTPPVITVSSPPEGRVTNQTSTAIQGALNESASLTVNGQAVAVHGDLGFSHAVSLQEGLNPFAFAATDPAGNQGSLTLNLSLDTVSPPAPVLALITVTEPDNGQVAVTGSPGSVEAGAQVVITNLRSAQTVTVVANSDGSFSARIAAAAGDALPLVVTDAAGNPSPPAEAGGNRPPQFASPGDHAISPGARFTLPVIASDADGDPLHYSVTPLPLPVNATFDAATGVFRFQPAGGQTGAYRLTFAVSDGFATVAHSVTITVVAPAPGASTSFTGRLLDANAFSSGATLPIVGATISILNTGRSSTSGADGYFTITNLPSGNQVFDIDPRNADSAPDGSAYASFRENYSLQPDVLNDAGRPFFLPRIDA